jgi:hypothetical protein
MLQGSGGSSPLIHTRNRNRVVLGTLAQTTPVPDCDPLAEIVIMPPGIPTGGRTDPVANGCVVRVCDEPLHR